ncbi:type VI secretion protein IcmF/TssM N-terminal domain-containing protein [Pigmentibacter ruber]|uniref:type VI secretion protein IcmF/TssM N-terminal domain-containing protein n=1 Tax=Pigmentibacter ruber TaxID=2683196 RepID=UPI00131DD872|nr:type VI secretion protein IcmF/TssM N-terminal domain-containing protein [Pigmentibacter ruber]
MILNLNKLLATNSILFFLVYFSFIFIVFISAFLVFYWLFLKNKKMKKIKLKKSKKISFPKKMSFSNAFKFFKKDAFFLYLKSSISDLKKLNNQKFNPNFIVSFGIYKDEKRDIFKNPNLIFNSEEKFESLLEVKTYNENILIDIDQQSLFFKYGAVNYKKSIKKIISTIAKFRYLKPISSIILKIPITEIADIYFESQTIKKEKIKILALNYQNILNYIQNLSGLKIPVYLFVTELEEIYGFNQFTSQLSEDVKNQIFGWSNPYDLEAIFKENFFDEAINSILEKIKQFNIEKQICDGENIYNKDTINFPLELELYLIELKEFINIIFNNKSFNHSYTLRGIYLTGFEAEGLRVPIKSKNNSLYFSNFKAPNEFINFGKSLFIKDVFFRKVLPEIKLSSPTFNYFLSAQRYALYPKIILPFLIITFSFSTYFFAKKTKNYVDMVDKNIYYLTSYIDKNYEQNKIKLKDKEISIKNIVYVYDMYNPIFENDIKSIFYPISYLSRYTENIEYLYNNLLIFYVIKPIRYSLLDKNSKLITNNLVGYSDNLELEININELKDLYAFSELSWKNENYIDLFNKLNEKVNVVDSTKLLNYLLDADLSDLFDKYNINFKVNKDQNQENIDLRLIKNAFSKKFLDLLTSAKQGIEGDSSLFQISNSVVEKIDNIDKDLTINIAQKKFNDLYELLNKLIDNSFVSTKQGNFKIPTNLLNPIERIKIILQKSILLSDENSLQIFENKIKEAVSLRNSKSLSFNSQVLGALFLAQKTDKGKNDSEIIISPQIPELLATLDKFKEKNFMMNSIGIKLPENIQYQEKYKWSESDLEYLESLLIEYDKFLSNETKTINPKFITLLTKYAAQSISFEMLLKVKHTDDISFESENKKISKEKILGFNQNIKRNTYILSKLKEIGAINLLKSIENSFNTDISLFLSYIHEDFNNRGFFSPKNANFKWWNGIENLAFQAYMVNDIKELNEYIELQKNEIIKIKNDYVQNLLQLSDFIGSDFSQNDLKNIVFWKNNIAALDLKSKDSSFLTLQDFIVNTMPKINTLNCNEIIEKYNNNSSIYDFFFEKQKNILVLLKNQCNELIENFYKNEYDKLALFFNKEISGKFPFSLNLPVNSSDELDIDKFSRLYSMYNSFRDLEKYKVLISDKNKWKDTFEFLSKLDNIFKIIQFDPVKSEADQLKLNFLVDLKISKNYEENTESIVEREFDFGNKQISTTNRIKKISWEYLDPTTISLRWAKDFPVYPNLQNEKKKNLYEIDNIDKKVVIQFNNKWSIFALQRKYSNQFNSDFSSRFLKFNVPVKKIKNLKNMDDIETNLAKIVMKISVENLDKQYIPIPPFPTEAPYPNNFSYSKNEGNNVWK